MRPISSDCATVSQLCGLIHVIHGRSRRHQPFWPKPEDSVQVAPASNAVLANMAASSHGRLEPSKSQECEWDVVRLAGIADPEDGAVWCPACVKWLNGPAQWDDHKHSRRHRNIVAACLAGDPVVVDGAIWCSDCARWLNGTAQWDDHARGKRHRSAVAARLAGIDMGDKGIWCPDCAKRLNSTAQWYAHKLGKQHRKKIRRAALQRG